MTLDFGFSPCPNDTFMFWGWVHGKIETPLAIRPHMADIEELNRLALGDAPLALTKVSASTYLNPRVQERYRLLGVGAALGRGCGPLVVSRTPWSDAHSQAHKIAIPGQNTTAARLARSALAGTEHRFIELRYDEIMPAILKGTVEAGVIIHESRFTYAGLGLNLALDLGAWWEGRTGLPLPLGLMVARRDLNEELVSQVEQALGDSLKLAWSLLQQPEAKDNAALWAYLREHAIELDDATMAAHIALYVNAFSADLGSEGRAALEEFARL